MKQIWNNRGGNLYLEYPSTEISELDNSVYEVGFNQNTGQFYLTKFVDEFTFDYKLYNIEDDFKNRIVRSWKTKGKGNLGVLLNGIKGTGKTVTSKLVANALEQPTVVVSAAYENVHLFLNSIPQDITIFIDEYEKIYGNSKNMLTIMDGALNSDYRRCFLMTTNELRIDDNMIERPSRVRYVKQFSHLNPEIVEEIVDDVLVNKEFRQECLGFISTLETITVDIVKEVLSEVNIHNESPEVFGDVFNVSKNASRYNVYEFKEDGTTHVAMRNAQLYYKPDFRIELEGRDFEINGVDIGKIVEVKGPKELVIDVMTNTYDESTKTGQIHIVVEKSFSVHSNYSWGDEGNKNRTSSNQDFLRKINFIQEKTEESNFEPREIQRINRIAAE